MKTTELIGPALDWAVAKCEGVEFVPPCDSRDGYWGIRNNGITTTSVDLYPYSTDWAQGGPIIEREIAVIRKGEQSAIWFTSIMDASMDYMTYEGPTPLIAAMRCYVASKLGDEVEMPKELM